MDFKYCQLYPYIYFKLQARKIEMCLLAILLEM